MVTVWPARYLREFMADPSFVSTGSKRADHRAPRRGHLAKRFRRF
jgi:hypothetical protein